MMPSARAAGAFLRRTCLVAALLCPLAAAAAPGRAAAVDGCLVISTTSGQTALMEGSQIELTATALLGSTPMFNPESFGWASSNPDVVFLGGSAQSGTWTFDGVNYVMTVQKTIYVPVGAGPSTLSLFASNPSCTMTQGPFNLNILALGGTGNAVLGHVGPLTPNSTFTLQLTATHEAPPGNTLAAVGVPFTLSIDQYATFDATGSLTLPVVTGAGGTASVAVTIDSGAPPGQQINITATGDGYPSPMATLTIAAAGGPVIHVLDGDGQNVPLGAPSAPIVFEVKDAAGIPMQGFSAQVQIISGDASFGGSGVQFVAAGTSATTAQFTVDAGATAGDAVVRINYPSLTSPQATADVTLHIGATASDWIEVVSGDGQILDPFATSAPIVVQTFNSNGPAVGTNLFMQVIEGDAVFADGGMDSLSSDDLDEDSFHTFSLVAGATPGPVMVKVSGDGFAPVYVGAEVAQPIPLVPIEIIGGDGQSAAIGSVLPQMLRVRLPPTATGAAKMLPEVLFTVSSGQGYFTASNLPQLTAAADPSTGEAGAQLRLGNEIGNLVVTASAPGFLPASFHLYAAAPGSEIQLVPVSAPTTAQPNTQSAPLVVELTQGGLPVANGLVQWEILSGDATLDASDTHTDANGRAQTSLALGAAGSVIVRASHNAMTQAGTAFIVSTDFQIQVAAGGLRILVVSGDGQSGSIGSPFDAPVVFRVATDDGMPVAGVVLSFAVEGPAILLDTTGTTNEQGEAAATLRFGTSPGLVRIHAGFGVGTPVATALATSFTPRLAIRSGDRQTAAPGATLPEPLVVRLSQTASAMAKGLGGVSVQWQVGCGNGTLQSATTLTDANGDSANRLTLGITPGCNEATATVAGVGSVTFAATGGVPSGSVLEIVSGGGQSLVPMEDSDPLRVRVRTAAGVAVVGAVVSFAADRAEAVLVPGEATTDSDGIASSIVRIGIPVGVRVIARLRDAPSVAAVEFTLNAGVVNTAGLSPRQIDAAHAIDMACPQLAALDHPTPQQQDLLARCTELVANAEDDPGDVGNALGEMLADDAKAQNTAALNAASRQIDNLKARFAALRGGARGVDVAGLNVLVPGGSLSLGLLPSAIVLAAGEPPQEVGADFARWGFFATGTVGRGKRDADSLDPGFEYDSYDITAGVDYRVTDSWILGAALGFNRNETDHQDDLGGMDSKGWTLSGYASWFDASAWYADAVLSFGRNDFDLTRRVEYDIDAIGGGRTRVDQIATASPGGDRRAFSIALGRDFNHGAWSFGPYLRATYSKLDFDGYTEAMSNPTAPGGGLALAVSARELKSLEAVLGARLGYALSTSWGVLLPSAQVEWAREFEDDPALLATRFAHDPTGTPILVAGERIDNDYFNLGVGLSGVFANGRSAYLQYERVAGQERMSSDSLAIGVRIEF